MRSCAADLGLDQPFYVQFARFVARAVQGNFGLSLRQGRPVATLLKERLPATLELATVAALLALRWAFRRGSIPRSSAIPGLHRCC